MKILTTLFSSSAAVLLSCAAGSQTTVNSVGRDGLFVSSTVTEPLSRRASTCPRILTPSYPAPVVAQGWTAQIIAQKLKAPRALLFDSAGNMLVLDRGVGILRLRFTVGGDMAADENGTSAASSTCLLEVDNPEQQRTVVVEDTELNHGLALSRDGRTLYASTADKVYAWGYDAISGTVTGDRRTLVNSMANGAHVTRTLLLLDPSKAGIQHMADTMLVSRGSESNLDSGTRDIASGRSQIRSFKVGSATNSSSGGGSGSGSGSGSGTRSYTDGELVGWGLRNSVGLAQDPVTGAVWSIENSADNLKREGKDVHVDNPAEEINFHGWLNDSSSPNGLMGANFGYPDCFALWTTDKLPSPGTLTVGAQFASEGSNRDDARCGSETRAPRLTMQPHTAPLDVLITSHEGVIGLGNGGSNRNSNSNSNNDNAAGASTLANTTRDMYITLHGSWNRPVPVGFSLVSVELDSESGQPMAAADSTTATRLVLSPPDLTKCPKGCMRPVGLAMDAQRRLYVTSDATGEIYVLVRSDRSTGTLVGGGSTSGAGAGAVGGSGRAVIVAGITATLVGLLLG